MLQYILRILFMPALLGAIIVLSILSFPYMQKIMASTRNVFSQEYYAYRAITINKVPLSVLVADTDAKITKGLGGIDSLHDNEGMLFVMQHSDTYGFWMKDMKFPIDIIWIDDHLKVVDIKSNVSPDSYPQIFYPAKKVLYVVEVQAGFVDSKRIQIGDDVTIY